MLFLRVFRKGYPLQLFITNYNEPEIRQTVETEAFGNLLSPVTD